MDACNFCGMSLRAAPRIYWLHTAAWDFRKGELSTLRQFGEELRSAADVELGTLVYMMGLRRSDDHSQWLLYIPDEEEREWVYFLCECRNKLAHHLSLSKHLPNLTITSQE